jgi:hypothetical protein
LEREKLSSASLPRTTGLLLLAELPALALEDFLDLVEDLHFLCRAFAVLGPVGRRDDDGFVRDHLGIVPADWDVTVEQKGRDQHMSDRNHDVLLGNGVPMDECRARERVYQNSHSLQRIVNRLRLFTHTLASVRCLIFQLRNARSLALFQALGVYRRQSGRLLLSSDSCDLEILDPRDGDNVVVAGVAGWRRAGVDCDEVENWAGGEEGTFEGLRLGSAGGEFDAGRRWVSLCACG